MKYKSEKTLRRARKAFSLIELMIVIVIIGALTAIILPQFDISEAEAKDAGCDASNYGTLAQLSKFRSLNGAYPARMHTGYQASESTEAVYDTDGTTIVTAASDSGASNTIMDDPNAVIPSFTKINWDTSANGGNTTSVDLSGADLGDTDSDDDITGLATSLREAGIVSLAYGGFPQDTKTAVDTAFVSTANAIIPTITGPWYEAWKDTSGDGIIQDGEMEALDDSSTPISINGVPLQYYVFADPHAAYANGETLATSSQDGADGVVMPLFIAPTTDWENWYDADGNANASKIQVAQAGACPWLEGGAEFRYYIAVFKVYYSGAKAKLLGTMCPEGGSLNP